jgi:hypothetical protein
VFPLHRQCTGLQKLQEIPHPLHVEIILQNWGKVKPGNLFVNIYWCVQFSSSSKGVLLFAVKCNPSVNISYAAPSLWNITAM